MSEGSARTLEQYRVGISISTDDLAMARGFTPAEVNRTTRLVAQALLGNGASLAFGHDWRPDGVMTAVHRFALAYARLDAPGRGPLSPLIINFVPWPDLPTLSEEERTDLAGVLEVRRGPAPAGSVDSEGATVELSPSQRIYQRANALTLMREQLEEVSGARLCLGGRVSGSSGRFAGVAEEAYLACRARKPLFLSRIFGGAAEHVIDAILEPAATVPESFVASSGVQESWPPTEAPLDPEAVVRELHEIGLSGLARANSLSEVENRRLFDAPTVTEVIGGILTGLARLSGGRS